jgi:serine/threonine protein kinase
MHLVGSHFRFRTFLYVVLMFYYMMELLFEDYESEELGSGYLELRQSFGYALLSVSIAALASCGARVSRLLIFFDGSIFALTLGRSVVFAFSGFEGEAIFFGMNIVIMFLLPIFDLNFNLRRPEMGIMDSSDNHESGRGKPAPRGGAGVTAARLSDREMFKEFRANIDRLPGSPLCATNVSWTEFTSIHHRIDSSSCHIYTANWNDRPVILKLIKADRINSEVALAEFETEAEVLSRLKHPHIVRFLGSGFQPRRFLVLELLDGGSLSHALGVRVDKDQKSWRRSFNYLETLKLSRAMASALKYLHDDWDAGITVIHRDLKPDNIGFTSDGNIKLFDFGLCSVVKRFKGSNDMYQMTGNTGTLRYMAPEVAIGKPYNSTVDVYSFGVIVWQILKGDVPFQGMGRKAFMDRVVAGGERPRPGRGWPTPFCHLLQRCWSEDKGARPSFAAILQELDTLILAVESSSSHRFTTMLSNLCLPTDEQLRITFYLSAFSLILTLACTLALQSEVSGLAATIIAGFICFVSGTTSMRRPSDEAIRRVPSHDAETAPGVQLAFNPLQTVGGRRSNIQKLHGLES